MASQITDQAASQLTAARNSGKPVATEPSTSASTNSSTRFFDFSRLARELRDKIYEQPVLFEYEHLPTNSENGLILKAKKLRTSLLQTARSWAVEFFALSGGNIGDDLEMLKYFLDLRAGPDQALCSIDIKILFEDILKEDIESGFARRAISEVQACEKVAFPETYLAEKAWDFRRSGKPKIMIARWDRSDDLHIDFRCQPWISTI